MKRFITSAMCLPATASVEESIARLNELHEAPAPVLTDAAGAANFTNEGGVDSTVRFLHNVMGLWVLSETLRVLALSGIVRRPGHAAGCSGRTAGAAAPGRPHDDRFLPPGDMATRIGEWLADRGLPYPAPDEAIVRLIVESLAEHFAAAVRTAARAVGRRRRADSRGGRRLPEPAAVPARPPTGRACPWWPARSRPPRWATC
ncbi:MAG: hypothetical protein R2742_00445 [Micropruina glycogenica]